MEKCCGAPALASACILRVVFILLKVRLVEENIQEKVITTWSALEVGRWITQLLSRLHFQFPMYSSLTSSSDFIYHICFSFICMCSPFTCVPDERSVRQFGPHTHMCIQEEKENQMLNFKMSAYPRHFQQTTQL